MCSSSTPILARRCRSGISANFGHTEFYDVLARGWVNNDETKGMASSGASLTSYARR